MPSEFEEWAEVLRETSVLVRAKCPELTEAEIREASHKIIRRTIEIRKEKEEEEDDLAVLSSNGRSWKRT